MYVIREAQEHHRDVELHLYRKVSLLVRLSVRVKSKKKVERTHLLVDQTCSLFSKLFHFFTLLVALSSLFLLPPRPFFFLVHHLESLKVPKH